MLGPEERKARSRHRLELAIQMRLEGFYTRTIVKVLGLGKDTALLDAARRLRVTLPKRGSLAPHPERKAHWERIAAPLRLTPGIDYNPSRKSRAASKENACITCQVP